MTPFEFAATSDVPFPSVVVQIAPEELERVRAGKMALPEGFSLVGAIPSPRPSEQDRSFHIGELTLHNFRSFKEKSFIFTGDVNLLIGRNGKGKTAILDALAIAVGPLLEALAPRSRRQLQGDDARRVSYEKGGLLTIEPQLPAKIACRGLTSDDQFHWELALTEPGPDAEATSQPSPKLSGFASFLARAVQKGYDATLPLISYYGTGRLWLQKATSVDPMKPGSRLRGYTGCLDPASDLGQVWGWFKQMELIQLQKGSEIGALTAAKRALASCLEGWDDVHYDVQLDELVARAQGGPTLPFRMLSDGVRNMLAMVADMAYRSAVLNPHLSADATEKTPGIVLIDELDLHLHPTWQGKVLESLRRTFPRVQFFATTHSPFIVQSLRPGELIDLDDDEPGEYYQRSIEDIAEDVMGVPVPQRSARWKEMMAEAREYYRLLQEKSASPEDLARKKARLDALIEPFSDNPAYVAFLQMKREAAGLGGDEG